MGIRHGAAEIDQTSKKIVEFILCARKGRTYLFQMSVWRLSETP